MKILKIIGISILSIILVLIVGGYSTTIICSFVNYKHNSNLTIENSLIYSQHDYKEYKFGLGNVADNGCGVVAIYNLLKLDNKESNLAQIIKSCEPFGLNAMGLLGTNPFFIKSYLRKNGYNVKIYFSNFETNSKDAKFVIYSYFAIDHGHYQLLYDKSENGFKSINPTYTNATFESLSQKNKNTIKFIYVIKWN